MSEIKPDYKNWVPLGGCFAIHDVMSSSRYDNMAAFVMQLQAQGYAEVQFIDTTDDLFMSRGESVLLRLGGSTLLVEKSKRWRAICKETNT